MKKTLLIAVVTLLMTTGAFAQKVWNFSVSPFAAVTYVENTDVDGLRILANGDASVAIDGNNKKNGSFSFTQRLKTAGSGSPSTETPYLPTSRALAFNVSGPGQITVACLSSSSSANRKLIITNGVDSLGVIAAPGVYTDDDGNTVPMEVFNYTGGSATIYIYSIASGVNLYYLSASSYSGIPSNVPNLLAEKGVFFNGNEIVNQQHIAIEVYDVLGKRVAYSNSNISVNSYDKGVYFVRAEGSTETLKFSK